MPKHYMSKEPAVKNLAGLFSLAHGSEVSKDDAIKGTGRNPDKHLDKKWFSYIITALAEYNFFTRQYSNDNRLAKLILTPEGHEALRTYSPTPSLSLPSSYAVANADDSNEVSITSVSRAIKQLRLKEPELEIIFDVRLKGEPIR